VFSWVGLPGSATAVSFYRQRKAREAGHRTLIEASFSMEFCGEHLTTQIRPDEDYYAILGIAESSSVSVA
jgi:hypothetical protein